MKSWSGLVLVGTAVVGLYFTWRTYQNAQASAGSYAPPRSVLGWLGIRQ